MDEDTCRRLDRFVRDHRLTIAVVFPVVGAGLLLAGTTGIIPAEVVFQPALLLLGVTVMRLPLLVGVAPIVTRRLAVALAILAGYVYAIEYVGIRTGLPYGPFEYGIDLGLMVGGVPVGLPLFFIPLVLNAYLLVVLILHRRSLPAALPAGAAIPIVLAIDLVLDPGAVAVGFWSFDAGGAYYGVPVSNYLGWALSATVAVGMIEWGIDRSALVERARQCEFILDDFLSFLLFWGLLNVAFGNGVPVGIAVLLLGILAFVGYGSEFKLLGPSADTHIHTER